MNRSFRKWVLQLAMAGLCAFTWTVQAQDAEPPATPPVNVEAPDTQPPETPDVAATDAETQTSAKDDRSNRRDWHRHGDDRVVVGGNSSLDKGQHADSVVSVFGSSTSDGDVSDAVVSVIGDTRVTGTAKDVIAVLGSVYLNGKASGDVVATMGDVELGPNAEVNGDVVVVGGTLKRDPNAIIHGGVQNVFSFASGGFDWLRPWAKHCLILMRPLAIASGLGWAWGLALGFLALYVLIGFLFKPAVDRCVKTFEDQPGKCVVAALLTTFLTPVMFALLFVTVIGIAFVPFAALALFLIGLFGKAVMLAWIGRCCLKLAEGGANIHTAVAVLIGGAIVTLLYLVPFVGFIVYKALGLLGLGVAAFVLIQSMKQKRGEAAALRPAMAGAPVGGPSATYSEPSIGDATIVDAEVVSPTRSYESPPPASGFIVNESGEARPSDTMGASSGSSSSYSSGASGSSSSGTPGTGGGPPPRSSGAVDSATAITYPRAGFGVRMAALFIDVILIAVLLGIIDSTKEAELIALATYGAIMWKIKSTTIGGIVFGLQVVRVDGRPIDWATATVRALSCFLSLVVAGLGFIWIAFDEGQQAWHDKIAGTAVVRVPKGVSLL